jgi:hypothetical protein
VSPTLNSYTSATSAEHALSSCLSTGNRPSGSPSACHAPPEPRTLPSAINQNFFNDARQSLFKPSWFSVLAMSPSAFALVVSEFMFASLLTPIAADLHASEVLKDRDFRSEERNLDVLGWRGLEVEAMEDALHRERARVR